LSKPLKSNNFSKISKRAQEVCETTEKTENVSKHKKLEICQKIKISEENFDVRKSVKNF